jgi:cell division protein FtsI/penicillin-binding protein 2
MNTVSERLKWRRILWLVICFTCLFAVLMGRLFVLMAFPVFAGPIIHGKRQWTVLRSHADMEHFHTRLMNNGRGRILYRTGAPIVMTKGAQSVIGIIGEPDEWPNAKTDVPVAGRSGLELTFNSILQGRRAGYAGILERAKNDNRHFAVEAKTGADIRTTIDYAWQKKCVEALNKSHVKNGAVVVLDVRTNEILAMASQSTQKLTNNAVREFTPGSTFKLVVAAAALETHRFSQSAHFFCNGRMDTPQIHMNCWRPHGYESFLDSIVQSCDITFANIGIFLGRSPIENMFHQIGLDTSGLQKIHGKNVLPEALAGSVFDRPGQDEGLLANTAIGQEDVRMSPLQGAILASTIANKGITRQAAMIVDAEKSGRLEYSYLDARSYHRAFSEATAGFLAAAMRGVVENKNGTFHDLYPYPIAVKTGTAELTDRRFVNAWVIGYMQQENPDVAFAVLSNHVSSSVGHAQIRQIVRDLADLYMQIHQESLIR